MPEREQIHVWIDTDLLEKFDAKRDGLTRSIIIVKFMEGWVQGDIKIKLPT